MLIIICIALNFPSFAQGEAEWESHYHHYWGHYESTFSCGHLLSNKHRDSLDRGYRHPCSTLYFGLWLDSTYSIALWGKKSVDGEVVEFDYEFKGTYYVDETGLIKLNGTHPFKSDEFQIIERPWKHIDNDGTASRGFKLKFNRSFNWIWRRKLDTYCEGCLFNPEDY